MSKARYHHTSLFRGYVSKKRYPDGLKEAYKGRFGKGYTIKYHNPNSTMYAFVEYYIFEEV